MDNYDGILMGFLDSDLYKFTMQQVVLHHFSQVEVEYEFRCRNKNIAMGVQLGQIMYEIEKEINKMKNLRLTSDEKRKFKEKAPYLKDDYFDFLERFRYNPEKEVSVYIEKGELAIRIKGTWLQTILYEVPILAIVSELASKSSFEFQTSDWRNVAITKLNEKVNKIKNHILYDKFKFSDFGTRRRASADNQEMVVRYLNEQLNILGNGCFSGTSNVHLAIKYDIKAIGTQAHEYFQAFQVLSPLSTHLSDALEYWEREYSGVLGIALTDSINMNAFLKSFSRGKSILFSGCRHDSGDPYIWCDKLINHYTKFGIDPKTKQAVFSDNLTIDSAFEILEQFEDKILVSFGIGTHLTNDIGITPASIVIKMVYCSSIYGGDLYPVAKISDTPEKLISKCDKYSEYLKEIYNIH